MRNLSRAVTIWRWFWLDALRTPHRGTIALELILTQELFDDLRDPLR